MSAKILVFAGSTRAGSLNAKLARLVAIELRNKGAAVTEANLADYSMPLYNGDEEARSGPPANAVAFRALIGEHHGVFIASPEYNSGYSPLIKNSLDWASRIKNAAGAMTPPFAGKVVGLGAVGFSMGGYRGLTQLRTMLELGMGALVLPGMISVFGGGGGFKEDGSLVEERSIGMLNALVASLVKESGRVAL